MAPLLPIRHLYVHIPFCPAKCSYCAFVTHIGSLRLMEPYLGVLAIDIHRQSQHPRAATLETVYFGGGTPSMMTVEQATRIIDTIRHSFGIAENPEITIEAHPDTVDPEKLAGFRRAGINRISFGGESFDSGELEALGRSHGPDRVLAVVDNALAAGFTSVALDLMYGLPFQTQSSWRRSLKRAVSSGAGHLSLYPLQIEPRTVFGRRYREGQLRLPTDASTVAMYHAACSLLENRGFEHYELSTWSRVGPCRHNLAGWLNREFFAAGVGAHAYVRPYRTENLRSVSRFIQVIDRGESPVALSETIDASIEAAETAMLRLRLLQDGLDLDEHLRRYGVDLSSHRREDVAELISHGLVRRDGSSLRLDESAVPVANEVISRLM